MMKPMVIKQIMLFVSMFSNGAKEKPEEGQSQQVVKQYEKKEVQQTVLNMQNYNGTKLKSSPQIAKLHNEEKHIKQLIEQEKGLNPSTERVESFLKFHTIQQQN